VLLVECYLAFCASALVFDPWHQVHKQQHAYPQLRAVSSVFGGLVSPRDYPVVALLVAVAELAEVEEAAEVEGLLAELGQRRSLGVVCLAAFAAYAEFHREPFSLVAVV
jgi:hypothetical protein